MPFFVNCIYFQVHLCIRSARKFKRQTSGKLVAFENTDNLWSILWWIREVHFYIQSFVWCISINVFVCVCKTPCCTAYLQNEIISNLNFENTRNIYEDINIAWKNFLFLQEIHENNKLPFSGITRETQFILFIWPFSVWTLNVKHYVAISFIFTVVLPGMYSDPFLPFLSREIPSGIFQSS